MSDAGTIAPAAALLSWLGSLDPGPLFALSLLPYLAFLYWAQRSGRFPPLAMAGFRMTLVFVAVTIAASLLAERRYGRLLADVDALHGGAEALLTLSNLLVLLGFRQLLSGPDQDAAAAGSPGAMNKSYGSVERADASPEDGAPTSAP